jgi:hypothetical protein
MTTQIAKTHKYAAVLIALRVKQNRHEYYYGDVDEVVAIAREAEKQIVNPRIEGVFVRYFKSRHKMQEYIDGHKYFFWREGKNVPFIYVDKETDGETVKECLFKFEQLIQAYVKTQNDEKHLNKIINRLTVEEGQPMINSILHYIEDKLLGSQTLDHLEAVYNSAFHSKNGLLDLLREEGIDGYDTYQFVADCFDDEMVRDFMQNYFDGDLNTLDFQLVDYYDEYIEQKAG